MLLSPVIQSKYINLIKISSSWLAGGISGKPLVWAYPVSVGIELSNHCNLRCPHCSSGAGALTRQRAYMSEELLADIVREFSGSVFGSMLYFQGEPMMHPRFFDMLRLALPLKPVISTNGHFLDRQSSHLLAVLSPPLVIVSLDGISDDSYNAYRVGGNLEKVKEGIGYLCEAIAREKSTTRLEIQVLVNSLNEGELKAIRSFAKGKGAGIRYKSMQLNCEEGDHKLLPKRNIYRRYNLRGKELRIKRWPVLSCYRLWTRPVITWDGLLLPCCFDKDGEYVMGDLNLQKFKDIWYSEKYRDFRQKLLHNRAGIDICSNCTNGLPPWIRR